MNLESARVHSWSPTTQHQFHAYNPHSHNHNNPFPSAMSQSQQSFPPGEGPNDPGEQPAHYPPGHAYRRSHSNSPFRHTAHPTPYPLPSTQTNLQPPLIS